MRILLLLYFVSLALITHGGKIKIKKCPENTRVEAKEGKRWQRVKWSTSKMERYLDSRYTSEGYTMERVKVRRRQSDLPQTDLESNDKFPVGLWEIVYEIEVLGKKKPAFCRFTIEVVQPTCGTPPLSGDLNDTSISHMVYYMGTGLESRHHLNEAERHQTEGITYLHQDLVAVACNNPNGYAAENITGVHNESVAFYLCAEIGKDSDKVRILQWRHVFGNNFTCERTYCELPQLSGNQQVIYAGQGTSGSDVLLNGLEHEDYVSFDLYQFVYLTCDTETHYLYSEETNDFPGSLYHCQATEERRIEFVHVRGHENFVCQEHDSGTCMEDMFRCADDARCIEEHRRCDLVEDCVDGSDEAGCKAFVEFNTDLVMMHRVGLNHPNYLPVCADIITHAVNLKGEEICSDLGLGNTYSQNSISVHELPDFARKYGFIVYKPFGNKGSIAISELLGDLVGELFGGKQEIVAFVEKLTLKIFGLVDDYLRGSSEIEELDVLLQEFAVGVLGTLEGQNETRIDIALERLLSDLFNVIEGSGSGLQSLSEIYPVFREFIDDLLDMFLEGSGNGEEITDAFGRIIDGILNLIDGSGSGEVDELGTILKDFMGGLVSALAEGSGSEGDIGIVLERFLGDILNLTEGSGSGSEGLVFELISVLRGIIGDVFHLFEEGSGNGTEIGAVLKNLIRGIFRIIGSSGSDLDPAEKVGEAFGQLIFSLFEAFDGSGNDFTELGLAIQDLIGEVFTVFDDSSSGFGRPQPIVSIIQQFVGRLFMLFDSSGDGQDTVNGFTVAIGELIDGLFDVFGGSGSGGTELQELESIIQAFLGRMSLAIVELNNGSGNVEQISTAFQELISDIFNHIDGSGSGSLGEFGNVLQGALGRIFYALINSDIAVDRVDELGIAIQQLVNGTFTLIHDSESGAGEIQQLGNAIEVFVGRMFSAFGSSGNNTGAGEQILVAIEQLISNVVGALDSSGSGSGSGEDFDVIIDEFVSRIFVASEAINVDEVDRAVQELIWELFAVFGSGSGDGALSLVQELVGGTFGLFGGGSGKEERLGRALQGLITVIFDDIGSGSGDDHVLAAVLHELVGGIFGLFDEGSGKVEEFGMTLQQIISIIFESTGSGSGNEQELETIFQEVIRGIFYVFGHSENDPGLILQRLLEVIFEDLSGGSGSGADFGQALQEVIDRIFDELDSESGSGPGNLGEFGNVLQGALGRIVYALINSDSAVDRIDELGIAIQQLVNGTFTLIHDSESGAGEIQQLGNAIEVFVGRMFSAFGSSGNNTGAGEQILVAIEQLISNVVGALDSSGSGSGSGEDFDVIIDEFVSRIFVASEAINVDEVDRAVQELIEDLFAVFGSGSGDGALSLVQELVGGTFGLFGGGSGKEERLGRALQGLITVIFDDIGSGSGDDQVLAAVLHELVGGIFGLFDEGSGKVEEFGMTLQQIISIILEGTGSGSGNGQDLETILQEVIRGIFYVFGRSENDPELILQRLLEVIFEDLSGGSGSGADFEQALQEVINRIIDDLDSESGSGSILVEFFDNLLQCLSNVDIEREINHVSRMFASGYGSDDNIRLAFEDFFDRNCEEFNVTMSVSGSGNYFDLVLEELFGRLLNSSGSGSGFEDAISILVDFLNSLFSTLSSGSGSGDMQRKDLLTELIQHLFDSVLSGSGSGENIETILQDVGGFVRDFLGEFFRVFAMLDTRSLDGGGNGSNEFDGYVPRSYFHRIEYCPSGKVLTLNCEHAYPQCRENEFRCFNGQQCVDNSTVCDFKEDCADGSDEANCFIINRDDDVGGIGFQLRFEDNFLPVCGDGFTDLVAVAGCHYFYGTNGTYTIESPEPSDVEHGYVSITYPSNYTGYDYNQLERLFNGHVPPPEVRRLSDCSIGVVCLQCDEEE